LSITETVLVFVGIPALIVAAIYALVYGTSARRVSKRYRPGRPYTFAPVWFLAGTGTPSANGSGTAAIASGHHGDQTELPPGPLLAQAADAEPTTMAHGETGGASDRW
jgi:hypothetical protein